MISEHLEHPVPVLGTSQLHFQRHPVQVKGQVGRSPLLLDPGDDSTLPCNKREECRKCYHLLFYIDRAPEHFSGIKEPFPDDPLEEKRVKVSPRDDGNHLFSRVEGDIPGKNRCKGCCPRSFSE